MYMYMHQSNVNSNNGTIENSNFSSYKFKLIHKQVLTKKHLTHTDELEYIYISMNTIANYLVTILPKNARKLDLRFVETQIFKQISIAKKALVL